MITKDPKKLDENSKLLNFKEWHVIKGIQPLPVLDLIRGFLLFISSCPKVLNIFWIYVKSSFPCIYYIMKNTYKDSFLVINGEFMQSQRNET